MGQKLVEARTQVLIAALKFTKSFKANSDGKGNYYIQINSLTELTSTVEKYEKELEILTEKGKL